MLYIPVSIGEVLDKISILEIKREKIKDEEKLKYINKEYDLLTEAVMSKYNGDIFLSDNYRKLKKVNILLWEIEDRIRIANKDDLEYIRDLAVMIQVFNEKRAKIKSDINDDLSETLKEVKEYKH